MFQQIFGSIQNRAGLISAYKRVLEISFLTALFLTISLFYSFKVFDRKSSIKILPKTIITVVPPPVTEQIKRPPRPNLPKIPVEAPDDEVADDVTLEPNVPHLLTSLGDPPPLTKEDDDVWEFVKVQEKPTIIKMVAPEYPNLARQAGVEGTVTVKVLIDTKGEVEQAEIFKSIPILDQAALDAAKLCKFTPGKQRDRFVKVWMALPFKFKLK